MGLFLLASMCPLRSCPKPRLSRISEAMTVFCSSLPTNSSFFSASAIGKVAKPCANKVFQLSPSCRNAFHLPNMTAHRSGAEFPEQPNVPSGYGLVALTFASHAKGREFNPHYPYFHQLALGPDSPLMGRSPALESRLQMP